MKKLFSLLLCVVMLLSMFPLTTFATNETLVIDFNVDSYNELRIYPDGYVFGSDAKVPFTGKYYFIGNPDQEIEFFGNEAGTAQTYDVTIHNISHVAEVWGSAWRIEGNTTVNLTAIGKNEILAYNHAAVTSSTTDYTPTLNVTLDENSSLNLSNQENSYTPKESENVTINLMNDAFSGVTTTGTVDTGITYSCPTVTAHTSSYTYIDENSCRFTCATCNMTHDSAHTRSYNYVDNGDGTHSIKCKNCNVAYMAESHDLYYSYDNPADGHYAYCNYCDYESTGYLPHSYVYRAYGEDCIKYCGDCGYELESGEHIFGEPISVEATDVEAAYTIRYCENSCGAYEKEYDDENALTIKMLDEYGEPWEEGSLLIYVNGDLIYSIQKTNVESSETYMFPFDDKNSYVIKWVDDYYYDYCGIEVYLPGEAEPEVSLDGNDMENVYQYDAVFTYNVADYSDVDEALALIPEDISMGYSEESIDALLTALRAVKRMLPTSKQTDVDKMATDLETAINGLEKSADVGFTGVVDFAYDTLLYADATNVTINGDEYEYSGRIYVIDSTWHDTDSDSSDGYIEITGNRKIELINTVFGTYEDESTDEYHYNLINIKDAELELTTTGTNALNSGCWVANYAGVRVAKGSKLTINESDGSLFVCGGEDAAGIGGNGAMDTDGDGEFDVPGEDAGIIIINGSTVFAFSASDGAGIGGGYNGGAGDITINGGYIFAQCSSDDGAGIGCGDDGNGGNITINGGKIVVLSLDDDGAGIGGADNGDIGTITINGGDITVGSDDAAGIGSGQDSDSSCDKITINGGTIRAHLKHSNSESLIGKGSSDADDFPIIVDGGNINPNNSDGFDIAPVNSEGEPLELVVYDVGKAYKNKEVMLLLSDGKYITVVADLTKVYLWLPEDVTVQEIHTHSHSAEWESDEDNHWHECTCGDKKDLAGHTPKLVNAKEATTSDKGYTGDTVCEICGYEIAKGEDIPIIADTNSPQTRDNSNMALWISLLFLSALGFVDTIVLGKKRKVNR